MERADLEAFLAQYDRIAVVGGFMTGKTLVTSLIADRPCYHTDRVPLRLILSCCKDSGKWVIAGDQAHTIALQTGAQALVHCIRGRVEPRSHPDKPPRRYSPYHAARKALIDEQIRQISLPTYVFD